jgi:REP element-mobilizing transposase RayT
MAQSLASVLVHLVFSTKYREPLITEAVERDLYSYIGGTLRGLKSPMLAGNGTEDHVHILFSLARTISIADLVEEVKTSSSKWIKEKGPSFSNFHWQGGYGAFSVSESGVQAVKTYIANQKVHHKKRNFQDEFRLFLERYRIPYDERYVWD